MKQAWIVFVLAIVYAPFAQATIAPRSGGALPDRMRERMAADPQAYQLKHAWIARAQKARDAAARIDPAAHRAPEAAARVAGTLRLPVLAGIFAGETRPDTIATWQTQLFGANPSGNVTDYWDQVSYGLLNMTGDVLGWTTVPSVEAYYAGTSNGTDPATDRTGEFIRDLLVAHDPAVDFGLYDNDGPDGFPNSGDDDGFVDILTILHSQVGAECDNGASGHIWSHKWVYSAWNASGLVPYATNDVAAGGGFIQVDDYTIQPAWNCSGPGNVIDIGVFCHESGHALGLPDLYDSNGGGEGIGEWGIMGSGNWNSPQSPAHPCAWTRVQMGWVTPNEVSWSDAQYAILQIETDAMALRLPFTQERFRRSTTCAIDGLWSLYCGLALAEGTNRGWASPGPNGGYGSGWSETVERDFTLSDAAATPIMLNYDYRHDLETGSDFAYLLVDAGGVESVLATYTGIGSGIASYDLTASLAGVTEGDTYTIRFRVVSDESFADDDGVYDSDCGALVVDDVSVLGGGESTLADFETLADGWHTAGIQTEYWLVENRQPVGFDANLHNSGLLIWHIDDAVMAAAGQGNTGGPTGTLVRGVILEEADGLFNLNNAPTNRGEASDVFPGTTSNTDFSNTSTPSSDSHNGDATRIHVTNISAPGSPMTADLRAGDMPPAATSVAPGIIDNDQSSVDVVVIGAEFRAGATFVLRQGGGDIVTTALRWVDRTRLEGTLNPFGRQGGLWDLVVTNPDGQMFTLADAVTLNFIVPTQLVFAAITPTHNGVWLRYELIERDAGETLALYRSIGGNAEWRVLLQDFNPDTPAHYEYLDTDVVPGATYHYLLESHTADGERRELHRGSASIPAGAFALSQNHPNPFNPVTTIPFVLPREGRVALDVFDVRGSHVRNLASGRYPAGGHSVQWDGVDRRGQRVGSGIYYYRLRAAGRVLTRKMLLLK